MGPKRLLLLSLILVLSIAVGYLVGRKFISKDSKQLSEKDIEAARSVVAGFDKSRAYDLSDDKFESLKGRVLIVGTPTHMVDQQLREEYTYYDWPNWQWNEELSQSADGSLPPLLSRFRNYYGAFNTGGLSWSVRPGVHPILTMPYGKWLTNNGRYYYVSND